MNKEIEQYKRVSKYLKGTAKVLNTLAEEIKEDKGFTKESEDLMSKIGADLLFKAKIYKYYE